MIEQLICIQCGGVIPHNHTLCEEVFGRCPHCRCIVTTYSTVSGIASKFYKYVRINPDWKIFSPQFKLIPL